MNQACVSLEEVLAAALVRAASLVPETSGYLALAVADATSKLPYAHDDRAVLLTVDGSVMVPRKPALTAPPEAARMLRDLLRRLLSASTGTMPGLTSAARVRGEEHDVERVVSDIEAALIPVNRTAAKRALARLARETLRAKEMGKLRKKSAPPAPAPVPVIEPPPLVVAPPPSIAAEMARLERATPAPPPLVAPPTRALTPAPADVKVEMSPEPSASASAAVADSGTTDWEGGDATIADPEAIAVIEAMYRQNDLALEAPDLDYVDPDAVTVVPGEVRPAPAPAREAPAPALAREEAPAPAREEESLPQPALLSQLSGSRADELIGSFRAEDEGDPAVLAAASSLRAFAGVDEPDATKREPQRPSYLRPPQVARKNPSIPSIEDDELLPLPPPRTAKPSPSRWPFALFALGVLVLFAAWLYRPTLARDFFGLYKLVAPARTEPAAAPASADDKAPEPDVDSTPAAARPHDTHAASGSGDGARRRRD